MVNYTGNLHEKTLELNICAEMLQIARMTYPTAWFRGVHTNVEGSVGYDGSLVGNYSEVFFQFKKPALKHPPFTFGINNNHLRNQHLHLARLAQNQKGRVFYVFPILATENEVTQNSPTLLNHTFFADVADFPQNFNFWTEPHKFIIADLNPTHGILRSDSKGAIPLISGKEITQKFFDIFVGEKTTYYKESKTDEKLKGKGIRIRGLIWPATQRLLEKQAQ